MMHTFVWFEGIITFNTFLLYVLLSQPNLWAPEKLTFAYFFLLLKKMSIVLFWAKLSFKSLKKFIIYALDTE